jgi:RNA polymerase primary sigma factor
MGSIELLSRQGEIAIAKRIEPGREAMIAGLCESPLTFQAIIIWREELNEGKVFLRDIIDLEATYAGPDAKAMPAPVIGPDGATCSRCTRSLVRANSTRRPFSTNARPRAAERWLLPPPGGPNSRMLAPLPSHASPDASANTWAFETIGTLSNLRKTSRAIARLREPRAFVVLRVCRR